SGGTAQTGGGGGATSGGQNGSGGDASTVSPADLYPLRLGASWRFEVTELGSVCSLDNEEVERVEPMGGRDAHVVGAACVPESESYLAAVDGEIQQFIGDAWTTTLAAPLQDGARWEVTPDIEFQWAFAGTVDVPAGTFTGCWTRSSTPV